MITPAQLIARLQELGIGRSERNLTDWRQKGLLPPLRRVGRGRGRGARHGWDHDVLGQAIAAHVLLTNYARVDAALANLWASGYPISAKTAQKAWVECIERERKSVQRAASRSKEKYLGVGQSQWRELSRGLKNLPSPRRFIINLILGKKIQSDGDEFEYWHRVAEAVTDWLGWRNDETDRDNRAYQITVGDFIRDIFEWSFDNIEREDEAFRNRIAEILTAIDESKYSTVLPSADLYKLVEGFWRKTDYSTIFAVDSSMDFVQSLTESELETARKSLKKIRQSIQHGLELRDCSIGQYESVRHQVAVMESLGPFVAKTMISLQRQYPDWPLVESISTLHTFVMSVKSEDLLQNKKNSALLSRRVHRTWQTVTRDLAQLWSPVMPNERHQ